MKSVVRSNFLKDSIEAFMFHQCVAWTRETVPVPVPVFMQHRRLHCKYLKMPVSSNQNVSYSVSVLMRHRLFMGGTCHGPLHPPTM